MSRFCILTVILLAACSLQASWYWPFGSDDAEKKALPRLSELVAPASSLMDEAVDLTKAGQHGLAIEKYREALRKLDEVEAANPDFESEAFRKKRVLVQGQIDALEHAQVQLNARPVVTCDTRELAEKLNVRRCLSYLNAAHAAATLDEARKAISNALTYGTNGVYFTSTCASGAAVLLDRNDPAFAGRLLLQSVKRLSRDGMPTNAADVALLTNALTEARFSSEVWKKGHANESAEALRAFGVTTNALEELEALIVGVKKAEKAEKAAKAEVKLDGVKAKDKREQAILDILRGDFAAADLLIEEALAVNPSDVVWLNLKAAKAAHAGNLEEAEGALDLAIMTSPRSYCAYYNMVLLTLKKNPDAKDSARRYYETGRTYGGPKDETLETLFK